MTSIFTMNSLSFIIISILNSSDLLICRPGKYTNRNMYLLIMKHFNVGWRKFETFIHVLTRLVCIKRKMQNSLN